MANTSISKSVKLVEEVAEKAVQISAPIIAISMLSAAIFGTIDALSFLFAEDTMTKVLRSTGIFSEDTLPLAVGGISAAFALFIAVIIEKWLESRFTLLKSPYIDASGIIIGTILVIAGVRIYNKIYPSVHLSAKPRKNSEKAPQGTQHNYAIL